MRAARVDDEGVQASSLKNGCQAGGWVLWVERDVGAAGPEDAEDAGIGFETAGGEDADAWGRVVAKAESAQPSCDLSGAGGQICVRVLAIIDDQGQRFGVGVGVAE